MMETKINWKAMSKEFSGSFIFWYNSPIQTSQTTYHADLYTHAHTHAHTCTHTRMHTHARTHAHTCIHTHTCIHMHTQKMVPEKNKNN